MAFLWEFYQPYCRPYELKTVYMSPVMTNVNSSSALSAAYPFHLIAVSKVFGKLFSNKRERSGSTIIEVRRAMVLSTAGDVKVRQLGAGLW